MNDRIVIDSIKIQNFRSIRSESFQCQDMNVFVGLNDVGKSNFLKALNLFFNGQTDYGILFDFEHDFSHLFPTGSHAAKEIRIEIKFTVPNSFSESGIYIWTKVWRGGGYYVESITNSIGEKPNERSRIPNALRRVKYRYVPAVKSAEYYKSLLGELYNTVSSVIDSPLKDSIDSFSGVLQGYTSQISLEVRSKVGIHSEITFPEDLNEIFQNLIFQTSANGVSSFQVPLSKRGDGIQSRHIPIILKYIADEDQKTRSRGSMKIHTIWGYEEPENGVELSMAFELANNFKEYSKEIQMFVTSHSPAFYFQRDDANQVLYAHRNELAEGTKLARDIRSLTIGENMGLLPIVAPYIEQQRLQFEKEKEALTEAKSLYEKDSLLDVPTIFVEGKTDEAYLKLAINTFSPALSKCLEEAKLRIYSREGQGGCIMLANLLHAWIHFGNKSKCLALLDKDEAGINAKTKINESELVKRHSAIVAAKYMEPSEDIRKVLEKRGSAFLYEIEHLLSVDCWKMLIANHWASARNNNELFDMVRGIIGVKQTPESALYSLTENSAFVDTVIKHQPLNEKKGAICRFVVQQVEAGRTDLISGFEQTVKTIERHFAKELKLDVGSKPVTTKQ